MDILIRPGEPKDAAAVSQLALRAKSSWGYPSEWLEAWHDALVVSPEYLSTHDSLVAVCGGEVVGVCVLESRGLHASLEHVWVAPEHQRRGIGRALVERALRAAARAGVSRVEVESDPFAAAFYVGLGARSIGEKPAPMPGAPGRVLPLLEFALG